MHGIFCVFSRQSDANEYMLGKLHEVISASIWRNVMSAIIALAQRKGGVGKTTLAVNVAGELCRRGFDVGLVDADPQRSACLWAELGQLHFEVHEMSLGDSVPQWAQTIRDLPHTHVIMDCAPHDRILGAACALASLVLVPCTPSGLDLEAAAQTLSIVSAVRHRRRSDLKVILVPNRVDSRTLEGRQLVEEMASFSERVGPIIGSRTSFVRAFSAGRAICDFDPRGPASTEIAALCELLLQEQEQPQAPTRSEAEATMRRSPGAARAS
jgi:chromosome partitioning protein